MSDDPRIEELEEANQQLQDSLKLCHELVAAFRNQLTDFRHKMAANSNEPRFLDGEGWNTESESDQS